MLLRLLQPVDIYMYPSPFTTKSMPHTKTQEHNLSEVSQVHVVVCVMVSCVWVFGGGGVAQNTQIPQSVMKNGWQHQ
eukprot:m.8345 g.8345  ORF g.8345 m.8345 type:complete len:77 (+) comp5349_c0_seq1:5363-5593(+)